MSLREAIENDLLDGTTGEIRDLSTGEVITPQEAGTRSVD